MDKRQYLETKMLSLTEIQNSILLKELVKNQTCCLKCLGLGLYKENPTEPVNYSI